MARCCFQKVVRLILLWSQRSSSLKQKKTHLILYFIVIDYVSLTVKSIFSKLSFIGSLNLVLYCTCVAIYFNWASRLVFISYVFHWNVGFRRITIWIHYDSVNLSFQTTTKRNYLGMNVSWLLLWIERSWGRLQLYEHLKCDIYNMQQLLFEIDIDETSWNIQYKGHSIH